MNRPPPHAEDRAFLPAALAVQQTPPSPLGRRMLWSIVGCLVAGLLWACWGELDIVSVAQGRVIARDRIQVVQSFAHGVIRRIHVHDGEQVVRGQRLVTLDPVAAKAERDRVFAAANAEEGTRRRLLAEIAALDALESPNPPSAAVSELPPMPASQYRTFTSEIAALFARREVTRRELQELVARRAVAGAQLANLEATWPLVEQRAGALRKLAENDLVARQQWLEREQQGLAHRHELKTQQRRLVELESALRARQARAREQDAGWRQQRVLALADTERNLEALREELGKAEYLLDRTRIDAPVSGFVQQLAVHTVGGIVTPAQELMRIAPLNPLFEVDARLANRDVGHVRIGQNATVKVDSYPFTRYGSIAGEVLDLSADAVEDEQRGLAYALRIALSASRLQGSGESVELRPGMAVSVEIATGRRRVIEYLLTPLVRAARESLRER